MIASRISDESTDDFDSQAGLAADSAAGVGFACGEGARGRSASGSDGSDSSEATASGTTAADFSSPRTSVTAADSDSILIQRKTRSAN